MSCRSSVTAVSSVGLHVGAAHDVLRRLLEGRGDHRVAGRRRPRQGELLRQHRRTGAGRRRRRSTSTPAAAAAVAGITTWLSANAVMYLSWKLNSGTSRAPSASLQPAEMPHCQEPPPIFGPVAEVRRRQDQQVVADRLERGHGVPDAGVAQGRPCRRRTPGCRPCPRCPRSRS